MNIKTINNKIIKVGNGIGYCNTVPDVIRPIKWKEVSFPYSTALYDITYNKSMDKWVAVGEVERNYYSDDNGETWELGTYTAGSSYGVTSFINQIMSVGSGTNRMLRSTNGITFTNISTGSAIQTYRSVIRFNSIYIAVGGSTSSATFSSKTDSGDWVNTSSSIDNLAYNAVITSVSNAVAISPTNVYYTSSNGTSWSRRTNMSINPNYGCYSPTLHMFLVVGNNSSAYSDNVSGWVDNTSNMPTGNWQGVVWGHDRFVAVGNYICAYSFDGINWETIPMNGNYRKVSYNGNGRFVAVGAGIISYLDIVIPPPAPHEVWYPASAAQPYYYWRSVTYGDGKFVAVASGSLGGGTNRVMYSTDAINWLPASAAANNTWMSVTYGNGMFVAVAQSGTNRVMYSTDAINWNLATAAQNNSWKSVTYGDGKFVAVSGSVAGTNHVMYSTDAINWSSVTAVGTTINDWNSVTYGDGKFVAVSSNGTNRVMYSADAINWLPAKAAEINNWISVTFGNGVFVAISETGGINSVMYSTDAINWNSASAPEANEWRSVTYGNGMFVAVASRGATGARRVMYSFDAINWFPASATEDNNWWSVTYGDGKFVAVADNAVMYSVI